MTVIAQDDHLTAGAWASCGQASMIAYIWVENLVSFCFNLAFPL